MREIFQSLHLILCTACHYCTDENDCPKNIRIPDLFAALNAHETFHSWNAGYYNNIITGDGHGKASDCIACGKYERVCPHFRARLHLPRANSRKILLFKHLCSFCRAAARPMIHGCAIPRRIVRSHGINAICCDCPVDICLVSAQITIFERPQKTACPENSMPSFFIFL